MEPTNHSHVQTGVHHKPWEHTALKVLSFGGLTTAALALAPVVASFASASAAGASARMAIDLCTSGEPRGLAGAAYGVLKNIGFSDTLLSGGLATAGLSGGIAIGGLLLANYVDKHTKQGAFRWGSVIRWAALTTSILIALPAILPAISMGLNFLGSWLGSDGLSGFGSDIGTIGLKSAAAGSGSAIGTAVSAAGLAGIHALTCALPLGVTGLFLGQKEDPKKIAVMQPLPKLQLPVLQDGRLMLPQQRLQAAG